MSITSATLDIKQAYFSKSKVRTCRWQLWKIRVIFETDSIPDLSRHLAAGTWQAGRCFDAVRLLLLGSTQQLGCQSNEKNQCIGKLFGRKFHFPNSGITTKIYQNKLREIKLLAECERACNAGIVCVRESMHYRKGEGEREREKEREERRRGSKNLMQEIAILKTGIIYARIKFIFCRNLFCFRQNFFFRKCYPGIFGKSCGKSISSFEEDVVFENKFSPLKQNSSNLINWCWQEALDLLQCCWFTAQQTQ